MSIHPRSHLPVSARHAFALAFDLAVRRDALTSLVVPLLLRAPFILSLAILPPLLSSEATSGQRMLAASAMIVDYLLFLLTTSMMRFRARSVFNTPASMHPEPALTCYRRAAGRMPWLFVTELVRNAALALGTVWFALPGIYLGFKLSCATESVVLDEKNLFGAFRRSFRLTEARFERWLEMVTISAGVGLALVLFMTLLAVLFPGPGVPFWYAATEVLLTLVTAVIQYAWTFFYLRLVEIESPVVEEGPLLAQSESGRPRLTVVEPEGLDDREERNA